MIVFGNKNCFYCNKLTGMLDENNYQYKLVDVETEVGKRSFEKIITITKSDHIPVVAVNSKILAPGHSFKTIDECFGLIQELVE